MYIFVKYLRLFVLFSNVNKKIRSAEHNTHTYPKSSNIVVSTSSDHDQRHTDGPHRPTRARPKTVLAHAPIVTRGQVMAQTAVMLGLGLGP